MALGRVRVGLAMLGSTIRASHSVAPDQYEPGLPDANQPREHLVNIGMLEWDLDLQFGLHRRFALELLLPIRTTIIQASFLDEAGDEIVDFKSIHHRTETLAGVGDLVVAGRIGLILPENVPRWSLALRTGLSLPALLPFY